MLPDRLPLVLPPHPPRFAYVDLIRGLSALIVLVCHYRWFFAQGVRDWRKDAPLPLYDWLWPIYDHGGIAVQMFWILSGFVFTVAYGAQGPRLDQREFWVHRIARLYPLHFVTLVAIALLQLLSVRLTGQWTVEDNNDLPHFIAQLFFASNWFTLEGSFNGPIWSVSVEVLIYFVFVVYLKRAGLSVSLAIGLAAVGAVVELATDNPIALCLALFFAGVAIGIVAPQVQQLLGRKLVPVAAATLVAAIGICFVVDEAGYPGMVRMAAVYLGTPAVLLLFIALDYNCPPLTPRLHWVGAITYSVYLLHFPILIVLMLAFGSALDPVLPSPVTLAAWVALVILASLATYRWLELPAQRFIRQRWARPRIDVAAIRAEQAAP